MHIPVLYEEVIDYLEPMNGTRFIDATVGAAGHTLGLLEASGPDGIVLALDRDPAAVEFASERLVDYTNRVHLVNASYDQMAIVAARLNFNGVDGVLLDLGFSSMQLADSSRGFSFQEDGPLDMRFDDRSGITAYDIVNSASQEELARILRQYGEVQNNRKMAGVIVRERPIESTRQLAQLIVNASGARKNLHPATRIFQALRIAVNSELEILKEGLFAAVEVLKTGGRLAVISFHSLEDRIVKQFIRELSRDCVCPPEYPICTCDTNPILHSLHRKVVRPSDDEIQQNPRSRSARMRVAEKVSEVIS
jgi:16S rRNA (cytosine1402-N4)-methyltransferase